MGVPIRILHIDDNPLDAELVSLALEGEQTKLPTTIHYVQSKEEYLVALEKRDFDLILSDYRMGAYDGDQALAAAREKCPDIPFIMVTGELGEEMVIETLKRGATDYVLKDRIFRLVPAIRRALAEADLQRKRKEAEESLRESQRTLALAVDATKLGLFDYYPQTGELIWNALAKKHFGLSPGASVTYHVFLQGLHPEDRQRVQHAVERALSPEGGGEYHVEYRTIGLEDGEERWLSARGQVFFDEDGKAVRFVGATTDITAAKQTQEEIRKVHQDTQEILESVHDALYGLDRNWCFIYVNPKAERLLHKTQAELLGKKLWDMFPQVIGSESEEHLRHVMIHRVADLYETHSAVNGAWIEVLLSPKADGGISVLYRDISERKAQEEALRFSEERFSAAFRGSPYPELISRMEDGVFLDVNDATLSFYGMRREEVIGHSSFELGILIDPSEREKLIEALRRDGTVQEFPMHIRTNAHGERLVHLAASALKATNEGAMLIVLRDVTAERQAREEVADSLRRTSEVLESIQDAFYAVDKHKHITYVNRRAEQIWGRSKEELLGKLLWDVFPEVTGSEVYAAVERAWRERKATHSEWVSPVTGSWIEAHLYPTVDGGLSVYFRDISERKKAEEALQKSEERLRVTFERAPLGLVEVDAQSRFVAANEQFCQMLGYRHDELLGMSVREVTADEDVDLTDRTNAFLKESGRDKIAYEKRYRKKDGTLLWVKVTITALRNSAGQYCGAIGTAEDISEWKRTQEVLKESEERFHFMADNIPQLAWMADDHGWIFWYNQRWYDYTGTTLQEMAGWGWQKVHHPEHVARVVEKIKHAFEHGEVWEDTFPLRSKSGEYRWFLSRAFPIKDAEGHVMRWFGTNTDITEHREAEEALAESEERLQRLNEELRTRNLELANKELEEFSYSVSHDLKAPLRLINGFIDLLVKQDGENLSANQRQFLSRIQHQTRHMDEIIRALLEFSRISRKEPKCVRVDTRKLVEEVVAEQRQLAGEELGEKVFVEISDLPTVEADPTLLRMVFANLLSNAFKFTRTVHEPKVTIDAMWEDAFIHFRIADNGVGFPKEHTERLFKVFQRLHRTEEFEGTGVGLANVRKIVERHGGQVYGDGEEGKGAIFWFTLPATV